MMKKIIATATAFVIGLSTAATAQEVTVDDLLNRVKEGRTVESAEHQRREQEFLAKKAEQQTLLNNARRQQRNLEAESARLENTRAENERQITELVEQRRERLGQLQELFGVLQQGAGDLKAVIETSYISVDHPDRMAGLENLVSKLGETSDLPTEEEIRVWPFEMMREMIESARSSNFEMEVKDLDGNAQTVQLTRIGDFGIVGEGGKYYMLDRGQVSELPRQPNSRFTDLIDGFQSASGGVADLGIDPSRGQILEMEVDKATLQERAEQGGVIGYVTLGLGVVGVILAIIQWLYLFAVGGKVSSQRKNPDAPKGNNPLGRILQVYQDNKGADVETLELKLDEAILKETPALERFLTIVKLISAVAPLFGLLGTVTGMIATFQAITLFGTGDPSMMANGISMALVTTVEGLLVAIPTLMLHSFVAGKSKSIIHVLEEQSAGLIAIHAEKERG